ncbi:hypothetical protein L195_g021418 [Trifolium pratense]|uniref:Uncharacterized protein n=1 Tax=Trifolium pratense TaxID=57577 RepID=A0A2K3N577_TRIPR|nr:hypothetical protein L195_g021418 [Trifolium pratense]
MQKISEVSTVLESKEETQVETLKPKAIAKLSNKTQKSKEDNECEIDRSINTEQLLPKDNVVETVDANISKKKEHVQDSDLESTKDKPDEKPSKRTPQTLGQSGHIGDERKYTLLSGGKTTDYFLV